MMLSYNTRIELSEDQPIDFSLLLASSVHDIKKSLGMLLTSLDEVIDISKEQRPGHRINYGILRGEASRINSALIHLFGLYKPKNQQLSLNLEEVFVQDFLEVQVESQTLLFEVYDVAIEIDCNENFTGYFDEHIIAGVINNILVNCVEYTDDKIWLAASIKDDLLTSDIIDSGQGYPQTITDHIGNSPCSIDFSSGSTNLGLFSSQRITSIHKYKGKTGYIAFSNLADGGAVLRSRCHSIFQTVPPTLDREIDHMAEAK